MNIRLARPDEGGRLREIAETSESHWCYDAGQVRAWAAGLDFSAATLATNEVYVAEAGGRAIGFASLIARGEVCVLDDLWIESGWIGKGVGTQLFRVVAERARELRAALLEWEAEPHAIGFYERMGGVPLRDSEPTEFGRVIPVMGLRRE